MLVLDPVGLIPEDATEADETEITIPYDPKGIIPGERKVKFTRKVYIDSSDSREEDSAEFFRLAPDKSVCLLNVPFVVRATTFSKDSNGRVSDIRAIKVEGEEPKAYIHWVDGLRVLRLSLASTTHFSRPTPPTVLTGKKRWVGRRP